MTLAVALSTSIEVRYVRTPSGRVAALEIVAAPMWDTSLEVRPAASVADGRLVLLEVGRGPRSLPPWLSVEFAPQAVPRRRVAEEPAAYVTARPEAHPVPAAGPSHRVLRAAAERALASRPSTTETQLDQFLAAAAVAVAYPDPPPEPPTRLEGLRRFSRGREGLLGRAALLHGDALEWWLASAFGTPDALSGAVLLARLDEFDASLATELTFLQAVEVPRAQPYTDLSLDLLALRQQLSLWRCLDALLDGRGDSLGPALAALRAWRKRYDAAFAAYRVQLTARADERLRDLQRLRPVVGALERLDAMRSLGAPSGQDALASIRRAATALDGIANVHGPDVALQLGVEPQVFADVARATLEVRRALEQRRTALAGAVAALILERPGVEPLDRLLQALQASDVDGLERVLDEGLAQHLDDLLDGAAAPSLLGELARRFPRVTRESAPAAIETFRELLDGALASSLDGGVHLR